MMKKNTQSLICTFRKGFVVFCLFALCFRFQAQVQPEIEPELSSAEKGSIIYVAQGTVITNLQENTGEKITYIGKQEKLKKYYARHTSPHKRLAKTTKQKTYSLLKTKIYLSENHDEKLFAASGFHSSCTAPAAQHELKLLATIPNAQRIVSNPYYTKTTNHFQILAIIIGALKSHMIRPPPVV